MRNRHDQTVFGVDVEILSAMFFFAEQCSVCQNILKRNATVALPILFWTGMANGQEIVVDLIDQLDSVSILEVGCGENALLEFPSGLGVSMQVFFE